ncbi:hypothetical protein D3C77_742710 [compost metagenome]
MLTGNQTGTGTIARQRRHHDTVRERERPKGVGFEKGFVSHEVTCAGSVSLKVHL